MPKARPRAVVESPPALSDVDVDVDVVIFGAGISGIGAAHYLQMNQPGKTFTILEARDSIGGTWDLFRYPGIRSDSDLYTFGYSFKPWKDEASIASADRIKSYLQETVDENGIETSIRFGHKVIGATWSSQDARWVIEVEHDGTTSMVRAKWIFSATGYYNYDEGYTPRFEGREDFAGQIVHPQHWPEDLDYAGKKVVVIGSGATAVTVAPAMAAEAEQVTILQRTPTYILTTPSVDGIALKIKKVLGEDRAHAAIRWKNMTQQRLIWRFCQRFPDRARKILRWTNIKQLPAGYDVDKHFNPPYDPWDQRLCIVPDGDLFKAIREGTVEMATDRIVRFTEKGIELESGEFLEADIIVTATGLNLLPFGGIPIDVDGEKVDLSTRISYKGMMLSGVPNLAYAIGYTNSSWTLKIGLLCEQFTRLLGHMDEKHQDICWAEPTGVIETRPLLDFGAGYVQRSLASLPKQGLEVPWLTSMNYHADVKLLRNSPVVDEYLHFATAGSVPLTTTDDGRTAV